MKYQIWNGTDTIYTPGLDPKHGRIDFTPEEWKARYPWCDIPSEHCVLAAGLYNGGFCMPLSEMVAIANKQGANIDTTLTAQEQLEAIEAFDDEREATQAAAAQEAAQNEAVNSELTAASLASIASSMEYQNMLTLDDVEETV